MLIRTLSLIAFLALPRLAPAQDACLQSIASPGSDRGLHGQVVLSTVVAGQTNTRVVAGTATGARLKGDEGFRIASITKSYVAATIFRLAEDGRIELDAPITRWLPAPWLRILEGDGYAPGEITVRHLLSHASGLADHAQTPQFLQAILREPQAEWTRARDVARLAEWTAPVGRPGEKFAYSDTGYVLLGEIVEQATGRDLPDAVSEQLGFETLGLQRTWWERYEMPNGRVRAHQLYQGIDTYDWNPSMDLYGGGGLVASPADVARFFDALLDRRVFRKPATLEWMTSSDGIPAGSAYRYGVFVYDERSAGSTGHSGFWGTLVMREPKSRRTIAGAVTDGRDYPKAKAWMEDYVRTVASPDSACASRREAASSSLPVREGRGMTGDRSRA